MKKLKLIGAVIAASLFLSGVSSAAPSLSSVKSSVHHQGTQTQLKAKAGDDYFLTHIAVQNFSHEWVWVDLPGTPIHDHIPPGYIDDICADDYFSALAVRVYDDTGYILFDDYVANGATVTVYDPLKAKQKLRVTLH